MSNFNFSSGLLDHTPRGPKFSDSIDSFRSSDFFFNSLGQPIPPYLVGLRVENNPELKERFAQYLVQNEFTSNPDLSDDQIIDSLQAKYEDRYSLMERLAKKTIELRKQEIDKQVDNELDKK